MIVGTLKTSMSSFIQQQAEHTAKWLEKAPPVTKKQCVSLSVAATITYFVWKQYSRSKKKIVDPALLPPSVDGGLPIVGHLFDIQKDPRQYLAKNTEKLGPCFRMRMVGLGNVVVVTGPLIEEVMKSTKNFSFENGIENLVPTEKVVRISYSHKHVREPISPRAKNPIVYPIKHNFKENQIDIFSERIQIALETALEKELHINPGEEQAIDIRDKLAHIISRISCLCFAGSKAGVNEDLIEGMAHFTQKIIKAASVMIPLPSWLGRFLVRRFLSVEREMDLIMTLLVPELEKIRNGEGTDDEVTYATLALNLPKEDGTLRSVKDIAYYFNNVALASIHTTSHFASFSLHELACRPELVEALRDELSSSVKGNLTPETVAKLPLMDSFFREVLRCNADYLGMHHLTLKDTTLSTGHVVPKGYMVVCALEQLHQDLRYLPADPVTGEEHMSATPLDEFDAYRFVGTHMTSTAAAWEYLPFGMGAHACPGRFFAANEIKYVLAVIITRYNVRTRSGKRAKDNVLLGMTKFPPVEPLIFEGR